MMKILIIHGQNYQPTARITKNWSRTMAIGKRTAGTKAAAHGINKN
jgi:hypothetical protein